MVNLKIKRDKWYRLMDDGWVIYINSIVGRRVFKVWKRGESDYRFQFLDRSEERLHSNTLNKYNTKDLHKLERRNTSWTVSMLGVRES